MGDVLFIPDIESQTGAGSAIDSEKICDDAYSKISSKFGTSDTMSSLCSRMVSVSLPMLAHAVCHFATHPDSCLQKSVLGPILEAIPNLIAKLDQIRHTVTKSAGLLVKVVATTPAGFELMSHSEVVTPLASLPTIAEMQKKLQDFLCFERDARRKADALVLNAVRVPTFRDFGEAMGGEFCRILAASSSVDGSGEAGSRGEDCKAISDSELSWWPSKVKIPDKMRRHFPHVLFAEEVDSSWGTRPPGVLVLVLGLQWGHLRQSAQWLRLKPAMWFLPVSGSGGAAMEGAREVRGATVGWTSDRLAHFKYTADSSSVVYDNCMFTTPADKYSFRAGAAAAKAAYEKLQQFHKLNNLCIFHVEVHETQPAQEGAMLDEHGWRRLRLSSLTGGEII